MVKFSERSISIGLCVIALSIVVPSLLLKINQHHSKEQEWSSRQRGAVSAGAVREEVPTVDTTPPTAYSPDKADQAGSSLVDQGTEGGHALDAVQTPKQDASHSSAPRRHSPAHWNVKSSSTRPAPSFKQARGPMPVHAQEKPSTDVSTLPPDARSERREVAEGNIPASGATDPGVLSSTNANTARDSSQPPPQTRAVQAGKDTTMQVSAPMVSAAPHPKTRKDVEDELRNARMNGSLPRFGNPDPYGPGGSPSASGE
jgi:hypothetical protein